MTYTPAILLSCFDRNLFFQFILRGGWYLPAADGGQPRKSALWTYTFKNTDDDLKTGKNLPPPLEEGLQTRFDPGDQPFGLWVSNDDFTDGGGIDNHERDERHEKRGNPAKPTSA